MTVHDKIADARAAAVASIEQVDDLESLIALEPSLFGKKSELSSLKRLMGKVEEEERAGVGQALNEAQLLAQRGETTAAATTLKQVCHSCDRDGPCLTVTARVCP